MSGGYSIYGTRMKRSCRLCASGRCSKVPKLLDVNCESSCDFCEHGEEELNDDVRAEYAKLFESSELTDVDALLARWWRRRSREPSNVTAKTAVSVSPSTRLRQICRCANMCRCLTQSMLVVLTCRSRVLNGML